MFRSLNFRKIAIAIAALFFIFFLLHGGWSVFIGFFKWLGLTFGLGSSAETASASSLCSWLDDPAAKPRPSIIDKVVGDSQF